MLFSTDSAQAEGATVIRLALSDLDNTLIPYGQGRASDAAIAVSALRLPSMATSARIATSA